MTPMGVNTRHCMAIVSTRRTQAIRGNQDSGMRETPTMPRVPTAAKMMYLAKSVKALPPLAATVTDCTEKTMMSPKVSSTRVETSRQ